MSAGAQIKWDEKPAPSAELDIQWDKPTPAIPPGFGVHEGPGRVAPPLPESTTAGIAGGITKFAQDIVGLPGAAWKALTDPPKTPEEAVMHLMPGGAGQIAAKRMFVDPGVEVAGRARESAERGETAKSMFQSVAAGVPIAGPLAADVYEMAESGDTSGAVAYGLLHTLALGAASPKVRAGAGRAVSRGRAFAEGTLDLRRIQLAKQELSNVAKPPRGPKSVDFMRDVETALPDIAEAMRKRGLKTKGNERVAELRDTLREEATQLWDEGHAPMVERHAQVPVNYKAIAKKAMREIAPADVKISQSRVNLARKWIKQAFSEPLNVQTADSMIRRLNAELKILEPKFGDVGKRVRRAALKGLREQIDVTLERMGETGVKEINRRWGALDNIAKTIEKQIKAAEAASQIPSGILPHIIAHPVRAGAGGIVGGLAAGGPGMALGAGIDIGRGIMRRRATPGATAARAMKRLGRSTLRPSVQPEAIPRKLLPPPSTRIMPEVPRPASGVRGLEARSRVVRDPKTGRFKKIYTSEPTTIEELMSAHRRQP